MTRQNVHTQKIGRTSEVLPKCTQLASSPRFVQDCWWTFPIAIQSKLFQKKVWRIWLLRLWMRQIQQWTKPCPTTLKMLIYWLYLHCPVISLMLTLYSQKIFNLKVRVNVWNISIIISKNVGAIMNHLSKIYIYGSSLGSCDSNEEFLAGTENVFKKCFKSNWITTSSQKRNVRPPK